MLARPGCWSPTSSSSRGSPGVPASRCCRPSTATRRRRWGSAVAGPRTAPAPGRRSCAAGRRGLGPHLTPTPEMTELYREKYGYAGRSASRATHATTPCARRHADAARERARGGSASPRPAGVLYAPTWRDDLATNSAAPRRWLEHLDVDAAAARRWATTRDPAARPPLPHARRASRPGVVDVTDYPEINDLILASDVAVLDYSSLRFDFALTGRPMVFLVPDLEDLRRRSAGFLFPFEATAPGPFVATTDDVVGQVRDVRRLRRRAGPAGSPTSTRRTTPTRTDTPPRGCSTRSSRSSTAGSAHARSSPSRHVTTRRVFAASLRRLEGAIKKKIDVQFARRLGVTSRRGWPGRRRRRGGRQAWPSSRSA